jgi:hypothetical protein
MQSHLFGRIVQWNTFDIPKARKDLSAADVLQIRALIEGYKNTPLGSYTRSAEREKQNKRKKKEGEEEGTGTETLVIDDDEDE